MGEDSQNAETGLGKVVVELDRLIARLQGSQERLDTLAARLDSNAVSAFSLPERDGLASGRLHDVGYCIETLDALVCHIESRSVWLSMLA